MSWKTGKYADPILPQGDAVFTILGVAMDETSGGTPFAQLTTRIDEFLGEYDADDETILEPIGQTAWGSIWLPKEADDPKKALGKARRVRQFLEVMENAGAELVASDKDSPIDVLGANLEQFVGKTFRAQIQHRVDESGEFPTKAEINTLRFRRA